jgi:thiol-disulfide isomerase/thioredoxin
MCAVELSRDAETDRDNDSWTVHVRSGQKAASHPKLLLSPYRVSAIGSNYENFFKFIGFELEYEFVQKGFLFRYLDDFEVKVYQIKKISQPGNPFATESISELSKWIIEIVCMPTLVTLKESQQRLLDFAGMLPLPMEFYLDKVNVVNFL